MPVENTSSVWLHLKNPSSAREMALDLAFALFMVTIATYARLLLEPTIDTRMPFGTYTLAVIVVAWMSGAWPATLALITSTLCAAHFVIPPEASLAIAHPADQIALGIFFAVGIISILLFSRIDWQRNLALQKAEENRQLNDELVKLDQQKDQFLSLLAHELRSPLSPIGNSITILEKCDLTSNELRGTTQTLGKNFRHLVRLVNDLLDVSRYLRDSIQLHHEPTNLNDCLATAVEMIGDETRVKQHRLTLETPEQPITIKADQVRVCQILSNLLSNAVRYTPECGEIHACVCVKNTHIEIAVSDTGLGIPPSIKEQIFTPFFQANDKQSRFAPGLGLGLSIVKKLVELHGGEIEVLSQGANKGSTFVIRFPSTLLLDEPPAECPTSRVANMPPTDTVVMSEGEKDRCANPGQLRILIADDDVDTANTLSQLLEFEGFQTEVANSGFAAVRKYAKIQPQILLLDIGLPELTGYEVAERIRAEPGGDSVRIIAVSGWGAESDKKKGVESGFDAHFLKPVNLDELLPLLVEKESPKLV